MNERDIKSSQDLANLLTTFQPPVLRFAEIVEEAMANFQKRWLDIKPQLDEMLNRAQPTLKLISEIDWKKVGEQIASLPERTRVAMQKAAERGWFIGWHGGLADVHRLLNELEGNEESPPTSEEVDKILERYYTDNFDDLTAELVANYPDRAAAIKAAAHAHTSDAFDGTFVAIPVFIAQADGLLAQLLATKSPFQNIGQEQMLTVITEMNKVDPAVSQLLVALIMFSDLDFAASERERNKRSSATGKTFNALNRHQVMHGESSDYGTKLNSLKAFSLLTFVGLHVPQVIEQATQKAKAKDESANARASPKAP